VRCQASAPKAVWVYGNAKLRPVNDPRGEPRAEALAHGTKAWQIAVATGWALLALKDPGQLDGLAERAAPAAGWVKDNALKGEDTTEWLPPGDAMVGTRVWAPLRKGDKNYELGHVVSVKGGRVTIRRLTDREEVVVSQGQVHFGLVKKGTKVLGFCTKFTKLEPALVESVKLTKYEQQGDPLVTLRCLDADGKPTDKTKEGQLASVRVDPNWLPHRR